MLYAEVALNVPARKSFTYHIPEALKDILAPGCLVRVEFGVAMQPALVLALHRETAIPETKPVIELLDPAPVLSETQLNLAAWLSETTLSPIGACVWLMLPPGFAGKSDRLFHYVRDDPDAQPKQMILPGADPRAALPLRQRLLANLRDRGPRRLSQLKRSFPKQAVEAELERLVAAGMVSVESVLAPPSARAKTVKRLYPRYRAEDIPALVRRVTKAVSHADLLEAIAERDEDGIGIRDALDLIGAKSRAPLKRLIEEGLVFIEPTERGEQDLIVLEATPERIEETLRKWRGNAYIEQILHQIVEMPQPPTLSEARRATGATRARLNQLARAGLLDLREEQVWRDSLRDFDFVPSSAPKSTPDQQAVWERIRPALEQQKREQFLLHGVTGSGKTEIYLRGIGAVLKQGRSAIFLVPEIALTPQTVRRVSERFPGQVALVHGSLPMGERYDTWQRARAGDIKVIVGTRSALFAPLPELGLIVLDEEHDASYKQAPWMSGPHYHARDAAKFLAKENRAVLILGSATPDLGTWRGAQKGQLRALHLPKRIMGHRQRIQQQADRLGLETVYRSDAEDALTIELPSVSVIDMRAELRGGNTSMFSGELQGALAEVLARGEQAMLLLNRRGQATYVFCRDCGYVLECERCDSPLTYHRYDRSLRCHHCGGGQPQPSSCPECGSGRIRYFGAGTQQVESALGELFPAARTLRWDIDTAGSPKMHFEILEQFVERRADVLIGTQMIAKGLDLPLVTLVGVVSADLGLALPDYRAGERVFQILTQVAGRAGRGVLGGRVILQTYQPEHYVIQAAAKHDYVGFSQRELSYRRDLGYPPFRRLARIVFSATSAERAQRQAGDAARELNQVLREKDFSGTSLIGPAPCYFSRIDRQYRWQLLLRGPDPRAALRELQPGAGWQIDIDPLDIL
ncbi:MAG: primosomal protein N' [Chloroflexi bacterium]|nr:primosomal protein N' [Chloroflexota bacterium]